MFAAVRSFVHGLLAHPPGCPRCGSADLRRSHRPSPLARLNVYRYRCRGCEALFFMRAGQMLAAQERYREFFQGDEAECSARPRRRRRSAQDHDPGPAEPMPARAAPPVDLEAVERDLAAARARALRPEARRH